MRDRKKAQALAHELVSKMTIEERASQLKFDAPPVERLGVPAYNWWNEALHGVARAGTATMFPQPVAMASMFDPEMIRKIGDVVATEARAKYNEASKHGDRDIYKGLTFWSPNINLFRDPRWGRGQETYSEDPYLTAQLGVAYIKGLQGDGKYLKVAACAKHYAVHSGPEAIRHEFDAEVSQKDLWETYLPAFEAAVKEGEVEAVMGAYNRTLGEPCCGSDLLIRKILRGKWGFQGHFVSDCWAISDFHLHHHITTTAPESAALAIKMGCDVNCGNTYLHLLRALEDGLITEDDITTAAERLFTTRFMLGEFDENCEYNSIPYEVVECPEHLALSEEAARRSVVLLKNDGILPLDKAKIKTIGVIGPNANDRMALIGNYHGTASRYITVLEGIQDYVGDDVRVLYAEGCHLYKDRVEGLGLPGDRLSEAETVAEHSDVVVLVTGLNENLEGEEMDQSNSVGSGDKANLLLPAPQRKLMEVVAKTGKPVILVLNEGRPRLIADIEPLAKAVVNTMLPGNYGGDALANLIAGDANFSGKMPFTYPKEINSLITYDYKPCEHIGKQMEGAYNYDAQVSVQWAFGYGLSYTTFAYSNLKVDKSDFTADDVLTFTVDVKNTGDRVGKESVLLFSSDLVASLTPDTRRLRAFEKVELKPGETKTVTLKLKGSDLAFVGYDGKWILEKGDFRIQTGDQTVNVVCTDTKKWETPNK